MPSKSTAEIVADMNILAGRFVLKWGESRHAELIRAARDRLEQLEGVNAALRRENAKLWGQLDAFKIELDDAKP